MLNKLFLCASRPAASPFHMLLHETHINEVRGHDVTSTCIGVWGISEDGSRCARDRRGWAKATNWRSFGAGLSMYTHRLFANLAAGPQLCNVVALCRGSGRYFADPFLGRFWGSLGLSWGALGVSWGGLRGVLKWVRGGCPGRSWAPVGGFSR